MNILQKYLLIMFISGIGVTGQILMRKGLNAFSGLQLDHFLLKLFSIVTQPLILIAITCYGVGMIAYLFLLSKLELSYLYPIMTSLTFCCITVLGYLFLHETLNWNKILGITFILIGILFIELFNWHFHSLSLP